jgi:hypothetical protein
MPFIRFRDKTKCHACALPHTCVLAWTYKKNKKKIYGEKLL